MPFFPTGEDWAKNRVKSRKQKKHKSLNNKDLRCGRNSVVESLKSAILIQKRIFGNNTGNN